MASERGRLDCVSCGAQALLVDLGAMPEHAPDNGPSLLHWIEQTLRNRYGIDVDLERATVDDVISIADTIDARDHGGLH